MRNIYTILLTFCLFSFGDGVTYPTRTVDEDHDTLLGDRQRWMEEGDHDDDGNYQISRPIAMLTILSTALFLLSK